MKKSKVIFVNRSKLMLHVQCKKAGSVNAETFDVLNRKTIRLFPGQYEILVYYKDRAVLVRSKSSEALVITEVPAPHNSKFTARQIALNHSERNTRIIFNEQISVGSILDGSANNGI